MHSRLTIGCKKKLGIVINRLAGKATKSCWVCAVGGLCDVSGIERVSCIGKNVKEYMDSFSCYVSSTSATYLSLQDIVTVYLPFKVTSEVESLLIMLRDVFPVASIYVFSEEVDSQLPRGIFDKVDILS